MVVFVTYGNSFYQKAINAKSQGDLFDLLFTVKLIIYKIRQTVDRQSIF